MKNKTIKNKPALIAGIFSGLFCVIFLNEFVQGLLAYLAGSPISFKFEGISFHAVYDINIIPAYILKILITLASTLFTVFVLEIGGLFMRKTAVGFKRYALILFQLINVLGLIISVFYDTLSIVLKSQNFNDFKLLALLMNFTNEESIVFMIFVILIVTVYLNFSTRQTINYINY